MDVKPVKKSGVLGLKKAQKTFYGNFTCRVYKMFSLMTVNC